MRSLFKRDGVGVATTEDWIAGWYNNKFNSSISHRNMSTILDSNTCICINWTIAYYFVLFFTLSVSSSSSSSPSLSRREEEWFLSWEVLVVTTRLQSLHIRENPKQIHNEVHTTRELISLKHHPSVRINPVKRKLNHLHTYKTKLKQHFVNWPSWGARWISSFGCWSLSTAPVLELPLQHHTPPCCWSELKIERWNNS